MTRVSLQIRRLFQYLAVAQLLSPQTDNKPVKCFSCPCQGSVKNSGLEFFRNTVRIFESNSLYRESIVFSKYRVHWPHISRLRARFQDRRALKTWKLKPGVRGRKAYRNPVFHCIIYLLQLLRRNFSAMYIEIF